MKKLTKTTALILSVLMLFGCTSNSANGGVGDTTPPVENSFPTVKMKAKPKARLQKTALQLIIQARKVKKTL